MKSRLLCSSVYSATLLLLALPTLASLSPSVAPLPNFDKRLESPQGKPTPTAKAAIGLLQERVPGLKVDFDAVIGSPKIVSATDGFLTGPDAGGAVGSAANLTGIAVDDPNRVTKAFIQEQSALFGHGPELLDQARVSRDYVTAHNGLRTVVWEQQLDGITIFQAVLISHTTSKGELVNISDRFVPDPNAAALRGTPDRAALVATPGVTARQAVALGAQNVGQPVEAESVLSTGDAAAGASQRQKFTATGLKGETDAQLTWLPMDKDTMRLCWDVILVTQQRGEMFRLLVDARTGEVLVRKCLTEYLTSASYRVYTSDSPSPFSPGYATPQSTQPTNVSRTLVTLSAMDTNASPLGWIPDGGNETRGNNVDAHTDKDADNSPDLPRPQGSPNRVFDFPMDLTTQDPTDYSPAAVVQLFYLCNWYHDKLYELGFTEAAGNFQDDNLGRGGFGNDAVQADAQDGGGTDNANFSTPPDGAPGRMQMYVFTGPTPRRDGDFDAEVVFHEHTHGLSWRLVGGGQALGTTQSDGMGEGWSDFYGLSLLSQAGDDVNGNYAAGGYASYKIGGPSDTQNYYFGIRRYPYTTDMKKNPLTFNDIDPAQADNCSSSAPYHTGMFGACDTSSADEVHNEGEVWCVTLWDARANLINKYGWAIGNQLILQLVTDGMKLSPPEPNFLQARDAILQADLVDTGGANSGELWAAFAKRGMGLSATSPNSTTTVGLHEAYDGGPTRRGFLDIIVNPPSDSFLISSSAQPIFVTVRDGLSVTGAVVTATIPGITNLTFRDNGQSPDVSANDGVYSALFRVPSTPGPITMIVSAKATNEIGVTNTILYTIVTPPPNDNFASATKVSAEGAAYFSNNRFATIETNEPSHAGISTAAASLWWNWTPAATTNVLIDTVGSKVDNVLAVYTGNVLSNLSAVASAQSGAQTYRSASVNFSAQAGITYRIAVASVSSNSVGSLSLHVAPGGQADTNAPLIFILNPLSGISVTNSIITVSGTASDQSVFGTGVNQVLFSVNGSTTYVAGGTTNWAALAFVQSGLNLIKVQAVDTAGNLSSPATIQVNYIVPPVLNDFFVNAIQLTNVSGSTSANTTNATKEVGEPNHAGIAGGKSVWWKFVAPSDGVLTISTTNSSFDTVLGLYTGLNVASLTPIAANDDAYDGSPGGFSLVSQPVRAGQTDYIVVDGYSGASGTVSLTYLFVPATVYHVTAGSNAGGAVQLTTINSLGGIEVLPGQSADVADGATITLSAFPSATTQFNHWSGGVSSSSNPLTMVVHNDLNLTANFNPLPFTDGFESEGLSHLSWTTAGDAPWFVQTSVVAQGQYAARSGIIADNQASSLVLTTNFGAGIGSFDYKVSSETNWDYLKFYVDGTLYKQWSGEVGWANYSFALNPGLHTLAWSYVKDPSDYSGLDAAFIDDVNLPLGGSAGGPPPQLQLQRQSDGSFSLTLTGQGNGQYVIQISTNLLDWQNLSTNTASGGVIQITLPANPANQEQFYRAFAP